MLKIIFYIHLSTEFPLKKAELLFVVFIIRKSWRVSAHNWDITLKCRWIWAYLISGSENQTKITQRTQTCAAQENESES